MYIGSPRFAGNGGPIGGLSELNKTQLIYKDVGVQYKTNGGGRDTYIFSNNGGFSDVYYQPNTFDRPGVMLTAVKGKAAAEKKPTIHSKSVYYR